MKLDEAVKTYTINAEYERTHGNLRGCRDFRQLAEWLKELKDYRERMPSYKAGYNDAKREIALSGEYERAYERGKSDAEQKIGRWIHDPSDIEQDWWECSNCGKLIFSVTEEDRLEFHRFCGRCGAKMTEAEDVGGNHEKLIEHLDEDMIARLNIAVDNHVKTIIEADKGGSEDA